MNRVHAALAFGAALVLQPPLAAPAFAQASVASPQAALEELIAADRGFSERAARDGLIAGMAAMLDDEVAMPVPGGFARGRADALNAIAGRGFASRADWNPVRGGLSADGRHGFTWGYLTVRGADGSVRPGKYLSYWVRRPEGWRVALHRRVPRPEGAVSLDMLPPALPPRLVAPRRDPAALRRAAAGLAAAERAFSSDAQRLGLGPAFARWGSEDAANMGGADFLIGGGAIAAGMPQAPPSPSAGLPTKACWSPPAATSASLGAISGRTARCRRAGRRRCPSSRSGAAPRRTPPGATSPSDRRRAQALTGGAPLTRWAPRFSSNSTG